MKNGNFGRLVAAAAAANVVSLRLLRQFARPSNFGANLPAGPVPAGYSGFNWGTGANAAINSGPDAEIFYLTNPAASIVEFSRANLFDLISVDYQILMSASRMDHFQTTTPLGFRIPGHDLGEECPRTIRARAATFLPA